MYRNSIDKDTVSRAYIKEFKAKGDCRDSDKLKTYIKEYKRTKT